MNMHTTVPQNADTVHNREIMQSAVILASPDGPVEITSHATTYNTHLLAMAAVAIITTVAEASYSSVSNSLSEVWDLDMNHLQLSTPEQHIAKSVMSGIILVRGFTLHLYLASCLLLTYPLIMGKGKSMLLLWLMIAGIRSVITNLVSAITGCVICSSSTCLSPSCFYFVTVKASEIACSAYMWVTVNDFYYYLRRGQRMRRLLLSENQRSRVNSPSYNRRQRPLTDRKMNIGKRGGVSDDDSEDEWSLPLSFLDELEMNKVRRQNATQPQLIPSIPMKSTMKSDDRVAAQSSRAGSAKVDVEKSTGEDESANSSSSSVDSILAQAMVDWFCKKVLQLKKEGKLPGKHNKSGRVGHSNTELESLHSKLKRGIEALSEGTPALFREINYPDHQSSGKGENHPANNITDSGTLMSTIFAAAAEAAAASSSFDRKIKASASSTAKHVNDLREKPSLSASSKCDENEVNSIYSVQFKVVECEEQKNEQLPRKSNFTSDNEQNKGEQIEFSGKSTDSNNKLDNTCDQEEAVIENIQINSISNRDMCIDSNSPSCEISSKAAMERLIFDRSKRLSRNSKNKDFDNSLTTEDFWLYSETDQVQKSVITAQSSETLSPLSKTINPTLEFHQQNKN